VQPARPARPASPPDPPDPPARPAWRLPPWPCRPLHVHGSGASARSPMHVRLARPSRLPERTTPASAARAHHSRVGCSSAPLPRRLHERTTPASAARASPMHVPPRASAARVSPRREPMRSVTARCGVALSLPRVRRGQRPAQGRPSTGGPARARATRCRHRDWPLQLLSPRSVRRNDDAGPHPLSPTQAAAGPRHPSHRAQPTTSSASTRD
jgi:hypothetical protein